MCNNPGILRWCAPLLSGFTMIRIFGSACCAQTPDPITLIQGVEMARLQIPPSRLHFHVVYRDLLRKNESDHVIEFDGNKRRSLPLTPQGASLFYDGSQACLYSPDRKQASFRDIQDATPDALFDPHTLGLDSGLGWPLMVADLLPYREGGVEMVGREMVRGIETWHVRISLSKPFKHQRDLWIGDATGFPVYRYDLTLESERQTVMSFYESPSYTWLPSRVECSSVDTNGTLRFGLTVTLTKAEAQVSFSETNWTLAGLNLPVGTQVMDRRTKLTIGYWNGTSVTPLEVWRAGQRAQHAAPIRSQYPRAIVWVLLIATAIIPVLCWKGLREGKRKRDGLE